MFGGEGIVDGGGTVDPGVLGCFPCLFGIFLDVLDFLLCFLDVDFGSGFFVCRVGFFEYVYMYWRKMKSFKSARIVLDHDETMNRSKVCQ